MQIKFLSLLVLLALVPLVFDDAFATANYYGAYPDVAKRDASYVYLTVDMTGVTSSVTGDVIGLATAAHATSGDVLTGYVSQVMTLYDDSESDIELHSEVYGLDSDLALHVPYDCEIETLGCQDLGTATTIVDMAAQASSTGSKTFANDLAKTTEYFEDDTDASYITYRIEDQSYQVLRVGEGDHCVTRNGNTDGIIEFVEASSGCLAAGSTLWS